MVTTTNHMIKQARHKGFTAEQIIGAIEQTGNKRKDKLRVTKVTKYPTQRRYCGHGVAVVMEGTTAITIYADRVVTPRRDDQADVESTRLSSIE